MKTLNSKNAWNNFRKNYLKSLMLNLTFTLRDSELNSPNQAMNMRARKYSDMKLRKLGKTSLTWHLKNLAKRSFSSSNRTLPNLESLCLKLIMKWLNSQSLMKRTMYSLMILQVSSAESLQSNNWRVFSKTMTL